MKKHVALERIERAAKNVPYFLAKDTEKLCALCSKILDMKFTAPAPHIDKREIFETLTYILKEAKLSPCILRLGGFWMPPIRDTGKEYIRNLNMLTSTVWGRAWEHIWENREDPFLTQLDTTTYCGIYHHALNVLLDSTWDEISGAFLQETSYTMPRALRASLQSFFVPAYWSVLATHFKRVSATRMRYKTWVLERLINLSLKGYGMLFCAGSGGVGRGRVEIRVPVWSEKDNPEIIDCEDAPWLQVSVLKDNVYVPEKVWRAPETLMAQDVFDEPNAEVRRVMLETMGNEKFLQQSEARLISNTDKLKLYRVPVSEWHRTFLDGWVHIVHCVCPSTGREYYLRVPPDIRDAEEAIAWTFGETKADYQPAIET